MTYKQIPSIHNTQSTRPITMPCHEKRAAPTLANTARRIYIVTEYHATR